jgi:two-component system response regulator DctR
MTDTPTVYLCDDEVEVRESLAFLLRHHDLQVSTHASGLELLAAVEAAPKPLRGIFVLDEDMVPMRGSEVHSQLLARGLGSRNPVLFLSGRGTVPVAVDAMIKGAISFVVKGRTLGVIVPRILEALEQELRWYTKATRSDALVALWARLPPRQAATAPRVAAGVLNKVIAWDMKRTPSTAEKHRQKLFANLGVRSAPELATLLAEMRSCGIDTAAGGAANLDPVAEGRPED